MPLTILFISVVPHFGSSFTNSNPLVTILPFDPISPFPFLSGHDADGASQHFPGLRRYVRSLDLSDTHRHPYPDLSYYSNLLSLRLGRRPDLSFLPPTLQHLQHLQLALAEFVAPSPLVGLPASIRSLHLQTGASAGVVLAAIRDFPRLETVVVISDEHRVPAPPLDLSIFEAFTELQYLDLSSLHGRVHDVTALAHLSNLHTLILNENQPFDRTQILNICALNRNSVRHLVLPTLRTRESRHLSLFAGLEYLRIPRIRDLAPLSNLHHLHTLMVQQCLEAENLDALVRLTRLQKVHIKSTKLENIEGLMTSAKSGALKDLDLSGCKNLVTMSDDLVMALRSLRELDLTGTGVIHVRPWEIGSFPTLQVLRLPQGTSPELSKSLVKSVNRSLKALTMPDMEPEDATLLSGHFRDLEYLEVRVKNDWLNENLAKSLWPKLKQFRTSS